MFIGHFAVGFASKRAAPRTSLTVLLTAALFLDVLWPIFLWLGLERVRIAPGDTAFTPLDFESYPFSHSLFMALVWSLLFAGIYFALTRYRTGTWWVGLAVFSHWVLDWFTHRADLPLLPWGGPKVGLGLWNSVAERPGAQDRFPGHACLHRLVRVDRSNEREQDPAPLRQDLTARVVVFLTGVKPRPS